jgi:2-phospho-L-lactate guanylyltransferase
MSDDGHTRSSGASHPALLRPEEWHLVIPVKGGPRAKSRLRVPEGVDRLVLASALALDTVVAAGEAVGTDHVSVVTSDPQVLADVRRLGARTVGDPGHGLNAAVAAGLDAAGGGTPVAVLLGDVPALRPAELRAALDAASRVPLAFVPDAEGAGTVLLTASGGATAAPRFGRGSAAAHERDGAVRLELVLPGLRRDVDDEASLREALGLGVGRHTAALLAHLTTPRT